MIATKDQISLITIVSVFVSAVEIAPSQHIAEVDEVFEMDFISVGVVVEIEPLHRLHLPYKIALVALQMPYEMTVSTVQK